jgi:DtxR family transcriptional regulator, Mn-dependent transcriptional regulator
MNTHTEENYLKAIYTLTQKGDDLATTTNIAEKLETKASSVTDMVKRLAEKDYVNYQKYKSITLTDKGRSIAINIIRKHRLWECFLVDKLDFKWDEVHDIAEQLEHIQSPELTKRLDKFLGYPKFDPHGDPIPDAEGNINTRKDYLVSELRKGDKGVIVGVKDSSPEFLQFLENRRLTLGKQIAVSEVFEYDSSVVVITEDNREITLSRQVANNIRVIIN